MSFDYCWRSLMSSQERYCRRCQATPDGTVSSRGQQRDAIDDLLGCKDFGEYPSRVLNFSTDHQETDRALRAGERGPTILNDFHNREKISHFDHERIPERVVHARGTGAFGDFKLHTPLTGLTSAKVGVFDRSLDQLY